MLKEGMDGTIELKVQVNQTVIADGSSAQVFVSPTTTNSSESPLTTTELVSDGTLLVQLSNLSPGTEYSYTITFDDIGGRRLGGTIQGTFSTSNSTYNIIYTCMLSLIHTLIAYITN